MHFSIVSDILLKILDFVQGYWNKPDHNNSNNSNI